MFIVYFLRVTLSESFCSGATIVTVFVLHIYIYFKSFYNNKSAMEQVSPLSLASSALETRE